MSSEPETPTEASSLKMTDLQGRVCGLCGEPLESLWLYSQIIGIACPRHIYEWTSTDE